MTRPIHCGRNLQYGMALHFPAICQTSKINSEIHPFRRDGVTIRLELISARFLLSRYFRLFQQNRPKEDGCSAMPFGGRHCGLAPANCRMRVEDNVTGQPSVDLQLAP